MFIIKRIIILSGGAKWLAHQSFTIINHLKSSYTVRTSYIILGLALGYCTAYGTRVRLKKNVSLLLLLLLSLVWWWWSESAPARASPSPSPFPLITGSSAQIC